MFGPWSAEDVHAMDPNECATTPARNQIVLNDC